LHLDDLSLVLRWQGSRLAERNPNEAEYTLLKDLSHLPLLLFLALAPMWKGPDPGLAEIGDLLPAVAKQIAASRLGVEAKEIQGRILRQSSACLQSGGDKTGRARLAPRN
jgi:hypothetical protein